MQTMIGDPAPPPSAAVNEWPYSGFWRRVAALMIDNLILILPGMLAGAFSFGLGAIALFIAYGTYFESSRHRATWGKQACGIQVETVTGETLTVGAALLRQFVKLLGHLLSIISWLIVFLPAAFTARRQGLHDFAASSVVRHEPGKGIPTWLVIVIASLLPLVFVAGVLAAIAIPAYSDYIARAKVVEARANAAPLKMAVEEYFVRNGKLPVDQSELSGGPAAAGKIAYRNGRIEVLVELGSRQGQLFLTPSADADRLIWGCRAENLRPSHLPQNCR